MPKTSTAASRAKLPVVKTCEPITFFDALVAMRSGSRVAGHANITLTVNEALRMQWFRLETEK